MGGTEFSGNRRTFIGDVFFTRHFCVPVWAQNRGSRESRFRHAIESRHVLGTRCVWLVLSANFQNGNRKPFNSVDEFDGQK